MRTALYAAVFLIVAGPLGAQTRERAVGRVAAPAAVRQPTDGPWKLELHVSWPPQDLRISSDGTLEVGQLNPAGPSCKYVLPAEELAALSAMVKGLRPDLWLACYRSADPWQACCDIPTDYVTVTRSEIALYDGRFWTMRYQTELMPQVRGIPADLKELWERLSLGPDSYLGRYSPVCRTP